jgi:MFS family permease
MASEPRPKLKFAEKRNKAECLGLHLAGIRNLTGANTVITQGGIFIKHLNHGLGTYTSLIINSIQLLSVFIGLFFIAPIMGKKPLFLVTLPSMCLLNFAIVLAMIYEQVLALILILCIFMAIYGAGLLSPIWSYPSEIIPASKALPSNIFYWISLAICLLVPPLVSGANNTNPFPVFIFFGIYSLISFAHVRLTMRESNGLSYKQIIQSFK